MNWRQIATDILIGVWFVVLGTMACNLIYAAVVDGTSEEPTCTNGWCMERTDECYYRFNSTCYSFDAIDKNLLLQQSVSSDTIDAATPSNCQRIMFMSLQVPKEDMRVCQVLNDYCEAIRYIYDKHSREPSIVAESQDCLHFSRSLCNNFHACLKSD